MTEHDDEMEFIAQEIAKGGDPGPLGEDEPQLRPLCRECVRDLPTGDDGLCDLCRVVADAADLADDGGGDAT